MLVQCEAKVMQSLVGGFTFRCEGLLASALVEENKSEAMKLVRKELADLTGNRWQLSITEEKIHPALLEAAKAILPRK